MHACQSGPEQRGSCTHSGPFGPDRGLLAAEKLKEGFFLEENVLLCKLIPAAL